MAGPALQHLNLRVAWHDNRWNGHVCRAPSKNTYCIDLDRIRTERNADAEDAIHGKPFWELKEGEFPPCQADSGGFMNDKTWWRIFKHPYQEIPKASATHGKLIRSPIKVPPYSTFAVPFRWMLRQNQEEIEDALPVPLPPDEDSPFPSPWVFSRDRQIALSELFFNRIQAKQSLVFFYTKAGHPLDEHINRLIVGVGQIEWMTALQYYEAPEGPRYPLWDRLLTHSIRPDGWNGILLPYHDYLEPTGDPTEDMRRQGLLEDIAVVPDQAQMISFSHVGEHATHDVALSSLVKCLDAVKTIRAHGIAPGPWEQREEWLNEKINSVWQDRGAFPGAGPALEALGMRLGTSMVLDLFATEVIKPADDPWVVLDAILRGKRKVPQKAYKADVEAVAPTWAALSAERRSLLHLLSRFSLSTLQARRWFDPRERKKATRGQVDDATILQNPYRIAETDLGDADEIPVSVALVDRGLMPDPTIAAAHPVPAPSTVGSPLDWRRVRAALVTVLRDAAEQGDSLLTEEETLEALTDLDLIRPCEATSDSIVGNLSKLTDEIARFELARPGKDELPALCLQLADILKREKALAKILTKRAEAVLDPTKENWDGLLRETVREQDSKVDFGIPRYADALKEQGSALQQLTTRKLSVLVGGAGTGKTTVLGALKKSKALSKLGILFLAPTGKARVRLSLKTGQPSLTVAQFLYSRGRYDAPATTSV